MAAAEVKSKPVNHLSIRLAEHFGLSILGVFVLVLGLGYLFILTPGLRRLQQENRIEELNQERISKAAYLQNLNALVANYRKIPADDVQKIRDMIPFDDDLPGLTAEFEALAKENDVDLISVGFAGGLGTASGATALALGAPSGLATISINLTLEHANYQRIKLFIQAIERHLRIFDIQSMSLNPGSAMYVMSIKTYVHPPLAK
jgi:hypothetical protein